MLFIVHLTHHVCGGSSISAMVVVLLTSASTIVVRIYRFINDDGVRQGCPVAAFLYALSVQHIYEAAVRGIPGLEAVAIADDFTITGPALSVALAVQQLVEPCKDDGPILNFGKCKALWAYSTNHPSYAPFCAAMSSYGEPIPISYDAIPLLGAGVGLGNSRARFCNNAIQQHSNFFAAITHADMPVQAAMLLLRVSGILRLTPHARHSTGNHQGSM